MTGRFVPLDPPPDGLSSVVVEGRRRRRRRTAVTSSAAVAALAGVLALTVVPPGGGTDSLRPMPAVPGVPPTASPVPSGEVTSSPAPPPGSPAPTVAAQVAPTAGGAAPGSSPRPSSTAAAPTPQPEPGSYRTPDLVRTYAGPPDRTRLCGVTYSNDSSAGQVGWCVVVATERTARGVDLLVEVCRDGTSSGRLTYKTSHEADLEVLEDGRTLWQWSVGRIPIEDSHELTAESRGCWTWRAPWTAVDQRGERLAGGTYVLRARSLANELADLPPEDTTFTL